jgi:hypothetical protein
MLSGVDGGIISIGLDPDDFLVGGDDVDPMLIERP